MTVGLKPPTGTTDGIAESLVFPARPCNTTAADILELDDKDSTASVFGPLKSPTAGEGEQGSSLGVSGTASLALSTLGFSGSLARLQMTTLAGLKRTASPTAGLLWKPRSDWPQETQLRMAAR